MSDKFLSVSEREQAILAISFDSDAKNASNSSSSNSTKYNSTFDIPVSEQNYTDSHNKTHPIWAKNMFTKEYKSFDDLFVPWNETLKAPLSSNDIYDHYVKPHAQCLHSCYYDILRTG